MKYQHSIELLVRDYECDIQAVVNNGVYLNYLEHARHEFLRAQKVNFAEIAAMGINLVVLRAEVDYKDSLKSSDQFKVNSNLNRISRVRFEFLQDIFRLPDHKLMLQARIVGTSLNQRGRPFLPPEIEKLLPK